MSDAPSPIAVRRCGACRLRRRFTVKLGALDDHANLSPTLHLYTASAPPWRLMHDGLPTFPQMPPFADPGA
jgi:hypothetical protein